VTTPPVPTTPPPVVAPGSSEQVLTEIRARLDRLMAEFRTLLVSYLIATGAGR
jgi:hypothetical protein